MLWLTEFLCCSVVGTQRLWQVFGLIRGIAPFRLIGANRDYFVVSSDSGRIVVLEYNPERNSFDKASTASCTPHVENELPPGGVVKGVARNACFV